MLTINLGAKGSFVINKQQPKKQIWWSSPIRSGPSLALIRSGPKRFEYNPDDKKWYEAAVIDDVKNCRQVQDDINGLLTKEMKSLVGVDLKFSRPCSDTHRHSILGRDSFLLHELWRTQNRSSRC